MEHIAELFPCTPMRCFSYSFILRHIVSLIGQQLPQQTCHHLRSLSHISPPSFLIWWCLLAMHFTLYKSHLTLLFQMGNIIQLCVINHTVFQNYDAFTRLLGRSNVVYYFLVRISITDSFLMVRLHKYTYFMFVFCMVYAVFIVFQL